MKNLFENKLLKIINEAASDNEYEVYHDGKFFKIKTTKGWADAKEKAVEKLGLKGREANNLSVESLKWIEDHLLYNTAAKKEKFVKGKGKIVTFKKAGFSPEKPKTLQIISNGIKKEKGKVKMVGRSYDSKWYDSLDKLINAIDWKKMEDWHDHKKQTS